MDLLVIGTLAFDAVETPYGKRDDVLGGSASYCGTCASYFASVGLVGVIGADFPQAHFDFFKSRKIDTAGVQRAAGKTFRWRGVYEKNLNVRHTLDTQLNVLADFKPVLPQSYRRSRFVVLGNIDPGLQLSVLDQLERPRLVACDTMNYWIEGQRPALLKTLKRVQVLLVNDAEAQQLSGEHNLVKAATVILRMGPAAVIIKRGEHGALLFDRAGVFVSPAFPLDRVIDPTGAGDSFAGGMFGYVASRKRFDAKTLRAGMIMGTVMASFSVQDFSLEGLLHLTHKAVRKRVAEYAALTQLAPLKLDPFAAA
ncbi:MAG: sugar kinase [Deltaproteobacteria bacterium]|nr:sugar kinase [Deltaproteobacteria bacterium]